MTKLYYLCITIKINIAYANYTFSNYYVNKVQKNKTNVKLNVLNDQ